MERKKAFRLAVVATAATGALVVGTAAMTHAAFLGFGSGGAKTVATARLAATDRHPMKRRVITRDVYDPKVIDVPTTPATPSTNAVQIAVPVPLPTVPANVVVPAPSAPAPAAAWNDDGHENDDEGEPPSTAAPTPTTEPVTPTTQKPIPPMPANCQQPHLEDNGVWNCEGNDD